MPLGGHFPLSLERPNKRLLARLKMRRLREGILHKHIEEVHYDHSSFTHL